ncbi:MAG TPA: hypothetical protein VF916_13840 [Ktedonobacterales bacterium]
MARERDPLVASEAPAEPVPGARRARRRPGWGWRLAFQTRAGRARGFLRFWPVWERLMLRIQPIRPIPGAPHGIFLIRPTQFSGRPIELPDSTRVGRGDPIIELHMHNQALASGIAQGPWELLRMLEGDLRALAAWAAQPEAPAFRALHGVTLLSRAAPRLGFMLRAQPITVHARLERFFMMGLLALYNVRGVERLLQGSTYGGYPQEVWMARTELLRRYGAQLEDAAPPR